MNPRDEELRRQNMARRDELLAKAEEFRRNYKKPGRSRNNWLFFPLLAIVIGFHSWKLYTRPNGGWDAVFDWHNWLKSRSGQVSGAYSIPMLVFAALFIGLMAYFCFEQWKYRRQREKEARESAEWYRRLDTLVDQRDYPDYDELYIYLDDKDRPRLLSALERQPKGSRSLRAAVLATDPELVA